MISIDVEIKGNFEQALNYVKKACESTIGTNIKIGKDNYKSFFQRLCLSGDSPIKEFEFWIEATIPKRVMTHLVRHERIGKYVLSSRPDIFSNRNNLPDEEHSYITMKIDMLRLLEMCKLRLCKKAWKDTIEFFVILKDKICKLHPYLNFFTIIAQPICVWHGFCPMSTKCCGYDNSDNFTINRNNLILFSKNLKNLK